MTTRRSLSFYATSNDLIGLLHPPLVHPHGASSASR
jgi:hypothetical protein